MSLRRVYCPTLLIAGVVLMVPFETPVTLILGIGCLLGFVVTGLFLIATPEYLAADDGTGSYRRGRDLPDRRASQSREDHAGPDAPGT